MALIPLDLPNLRGRRIVITGTGGLGYEAAVALAKAGANVTLAGRNSQKGQAAVAAIQQVAGPGSAQFEMLDLASLRSIHAFAERMTGMPLAIDILINNAGIMSPPVRRTTADGFELQFGVNYLGHFALTALLLPALLRSPAPRVVHVTSLAHRHAALDFADLQSERNYRPSVAYCVSKLAQALFAVELDRRSRAAGIALQSVAAHPGYASTGLFEAQQGARSLLNIVSKYLVIPLIGQSAQDGVQPILYAAAVASECGGKLYGPTGFMQMKGLPGPNEFAPAALDHGVANRLWNLSEQLTGLRLQLASRIPA